MSVETEPTVPGHWLESLTQHQPAPWRWGRSVRSTLGIGLPMLIGLLSNDLLAGMWVALGALMHTTSERDGTYDSSFRHLAIATPVAMLGCLAGYLGLLPWPVTVAVMAVLAFLAGILSSFGAALSVGCLQALLLAGIAIGIPASASPWQPALLYLVGTLLYAALLGLEASFFHQRPGRNMLAGLFNAMASLAINRAERRPVDEPCDWSVNVSPPPMPPCCNSAAGWPAAASNWSAATPSCSAAMPSLPSCWHAMTWKRCAAPPSACIRSPVRWDRPRAFLPPRWARRIPTSTAISAP